MREAFSLRDKASKHTRAKPEPGARREMRQEAKQLLSDARRLESQVVQEILDAADVLCATLTGIDSENQKLKRFHDDIEAGKYLILIYARKGEGEKIKEMMRGRHPESRHVATDRHFINPFAQVERRRRRTRTDQVPE